MYGKHSKIFFSVSMVVLVIAIVMASWGFPKLVKNQVQKQIQIDGSSKMFEKWRKMPMPLSFKVYLFNVTNPEEINEGANPKLAEIGPFVYDEYRERIILSNDEKNDTVTYMLKKTIVFNQELSGGLNEDVMVTVINFPYMAAILSVNEIMASAMTIVNPALEIFFTNLTDPFLRVRVGDLLFDGIYLNCVGQHSGLSLICGQIKSEKQHTMRPSEDGHGYYFSMLSHLNTTITGPYEMKRGVDNVRDIGHIVAYLNKTSNAQWGDIYCGQINGSDSTIFPPIDPDNVPDKQYSFEPDLCRSMFVNLVGKRTIFDMSAYYYEISRMALASKSAEPSNKCFCQKNWSSNHDGCLVMGVMDIKPCQKAHAIVSLPHFYLASEEILDYVKEGIKADREKHASFVYIEPVTGAVLKGSKRIQFNIELLRVPAVPQLANVKTGLFPLLWIDEGAEIPPSIQEELRDAHKLLGYVEIVRWVLLALAIVAAVVSSFYILRSTTIWPKPTNSVSFMLRSNGSGGNTNKAF